MAIDLANRTIIITGASSGIGRATAFACARAGMNVVVSARRQEMLEKLARDIASQTSADALPMVCDVTKDQDVNALVQQSIERFGQVDAMFANAGYGLSMPVIDTPDDKARAIFETNFWGTLRCIRAVLPHMLERNAGHLLICSSAASEIAMPFYSFYCATKAAQDSLAGSLRAELTDTSIQVTSVHPIGTRTGFWDTTREQSDLDDQAQGFNTPQSFMQSPDKVARCIVQALRRPKPEVWPHLGARLGLGLTTAFPALAAIAMRHLYRRNNEQQSSRT